MSALPRMTARTVKAPYDTVSGCRSRAEADLLASVSILTDNARRRMERSAASWLARAEMLERGDRALDAVRSGSTDPTLVA